MFRIRSIYLARPHPLLLESATNLVLSPPILSSYRTRTVYLLLKPGFYLCHWTEILSHYYVRLPSVGGVCLMQQLIFKRPS